MVVSRTAGSIEGGVGNMPPATKVWGPSYRADWGATAILPGKFGKDEVAPIAAGKYAYKWVTVGGQDTDSSNWEETAERDIINAGARGCAAASALDKPCPSRAGLA